MTKLASEATLRKLAAVVITPRTHSWKGSENGKLKKCCQCGAATSGVVKDIATGKKQSLCSRCAGNKGF